MSVVCVLDSSLALAWVLPGEANSESDGALDRISAEGALVPSLWRLEVANTLLHVERRRRISPDERKAHIDFFASLPITIDGETTAKAWSTTLDIAARHNLTVYDTSYLELALRVGLPVGSRDKALRRAAQERGVTVLG